MFAMLFSRRIPRAFSIVVAAATAATVGSGLTATAANATPTDANAPSLSALSVLPGTVDVSNAAGAIGVILHVGDDVTGVQSVTVTATCTDNVKCTPADTPLHGSQITFRSGPVSAQQLDVPVTVPQSVDDGTTWTITQVDLTDGADHTQSYTTASTPAIPSSPTFTVSNTKDDTAPAVVSVNPQGTDGVDGSGHPKIDVTTTDKQPSFLLHLTVAGSGVDDSSISLTLTGPPNPDNPDAPPPTRTIDNFSFNRTVGTVHGGDYTGAGWEPWSYSDAGLWTVTDVHVADFAGNVRDVTDSGVVLDVFAASDSQGPVLSDVPTMPASAAQSTTVSLTLPISDDVSGFVSGTGTFATDASPTPPPLFFQFDNTQPGTPGTYIATVHIPGADPTGTYTLASLSLTDRAGQTTDYPSTGHDLPAVSFNVTPGATDAAPPTVTAVQVSPLSLSLSADEYRSAVAYVTIDDSGQSGIEHGELTVTTPLTGQPDGSGGTYGTSSAYFSPEQLVSGTTQSGTYRVLLQPYELGSGYDNTIPDDGTYTIASIDMWTAANDGGTPTSVDPSTINGATYSFSANHTPLNDSQGPVIDLIDVQTPHVDTTNQNQDVWVKVHATDPGGSGINSLDLDFAPVGAVRGPAHGSAFPGRLISGDDTDGIYLVDVIVPAWAQPGDWHAVSAFAQDNANNDTNYEVLNPDSDPSAIEITTVGGNHLFTNDAAAGDTQGPAVTGITVDQVEPIQATDGASYRFTGTITMTDDHAGVDSAEVDLNSPGGTQQAWGYTTDDSNPDTPPQLVRTMHYSVNLPAHALSGQWSFDVYPFDRLGNGTEMTPTSGLQNVKNTVNVTGAPDQQAPTLDPTDGFAVQPTAVDVTSGPASAIATFHVHDDISGVAQFYDPDNGNWASPTGDVNISLKRVSDGRTMNIDIYDAAGGVVGGSPNDAYFQVEIPFQQFGDSGDWVVQNVTLADAVGNQSDPISETSHTITVTGLSDDAPPVLNSITTSVDHTDLNTGAAHVSVSADITDDKSGVQFAEFNLQGPSNNIDGGWANLQLNPDTGRWEGTATIPQYSGVGTWTPRDLFVEDNANNSTDYENADLVAKGAAPSYTFTGTQDTQPASLASLSFNPTSLDVTSGAKNTLLTMHITDDVSGFSDGYLQLTSPNGLQSTEADFGSSQRTGGNALDGTYQVNVQIPSNAQEGTWTIGTVWLRDNASNFVNLTSGLLPTGAGTSVNVTNGNAPVFNGVINGTVTGPTAATPLSGAWVSVCNSFAYGCSSTQTDSNGHYSVSGLPDGHYDIHASAPAGTTFEPGQTSLQNSLFTYSDGGTHTATADLNLTQPTPMPTGITVNGQQSTPSDPIVPRVYWQSPINLSIVGCTGGTASYAVTDAGNQTISSGSLTENPPGTYTGTAPAPYPSHGDVTVTITLTCPNPAQSTNAGFTMYIDPSGFVKDTHGAAISGATVTLLRSDTATGTFTQVPDGSAIMSPSNRKNPDSTDASGHYGWDVTAGYYKVAVSKSDCYAPGTYSSGSNTVQPVFTTAAQQIPPAVTDLNVTMDCTNIAPVGSFTQSAATVAQHGLVHFDASASKDANGSVASYTWDFGDGTPTFTSSSPTADHSYNTAGSFTPKVTVTDDQSSTATKSGSAITVTPSSAPTVTVTSSPAALTNSTSASVGFTVTPNATATITSVKCALDGAAATACTSPKALSGLSDGGHSLVITATDSDGNTGTGTAQWVVDTKGPSVSMVLPTSTSTLSKTIAVRWSGADTNGVASFDVQYTKAAWNGKFGAATVWKSATTATSATFTGVPGYEYCFSVRARDKAGNVSGYSAKKCTALPLDDRALAASAGWKKLTGKAFYLGTAMQATAKGKTLTRKGAVAGRAVLYVDKGKGFGSVAVLYNGKIVKTVSLASTKTVTKVAIALPKVTKATVIVIKTTTAKKVQIDGLLLARI